MTARENVARAADVRVREANHRVANQLSLLTGVIQLQVDSLAHGPESLPREKVRDLLRNAAARIVAIGNLNRQLSSASGALIDLCPFLSATRDDLLASLSARDRVRVSETLGAGCHVTGEQATMLCLVMNEIIVNALKHARPSGEPVALVLRCEGKASTIVLELSDDGVGLPQGFDEAKHGHVGFKLIRNLLRQIGAELHLKTGGPGLGFHIVLPRPTGD